MAAVTPLSRKAPAHPLRTSERNMLRGIVTSITYGEVNAEVGLLVNDHLVIDTLVTNASIDTMGITPGCAAVALIKSSFITLLRDTPGLRISARNQIGGVVSDLVAGPVESEVVIDIGSGAELAAVVTTISARDLGLAPGIPVTACIKASHIILAMEE